MPEDAFTEAYKEALVMSPSNRVHLHTIQIHHEDVATDLFLVRDVVGHSLTLETAEVKAFTACGFRFTRPAKNSQGVPEMTLAMDDTDNLVTDYLKQILTSNSAIEVTYRPYLADVPTVPQMNPPLVMFLRNARKQGVEVVGRATFADLVNRRFPSQLYTRSRFPSLANG